MNYSRWVLPLICSYSAGLWPCKILNSWLQVSLQYSIFNILTIVLLCWQYRTFKKIYLAILIFAWNYLTKHVFNPLVPTLHQLMAYTLKMLSHTWRSKYELLEMGLAPYLFILCIVMNLQNPKLVTFYLASLFNFQYFDIFFVMLVI